MNNHQRNFHELLNHYFTLRREIAIVIGSAVAIFCGLCLISYNPQDPSFFYYASDQTVATNWCGQAGAYVSALLFYFFGGVSFVVLCLAIMLVVAAIFKWSFRRHWLRLSTSFFMVPLLCLLLRLIQIDVYTINPGGTVGLKLAQALVPYIGWYGGFIACIALIWVVLACVFNTSLVSALQRQTSLVYYHLIEAKKVLVQVGAWLKKRIVSYQKESLACQKQEQPDSSFASPTDSFSYTSARSTEPFLASDEPKKPQVDRQAIWQELAGGLLLHEFYCQSRCIKPGSLSYVLMRNTLFNRNIFVDADDALRLFFTKLSVCDATTPDETSLESLVRQQHHITVSYELPKLEMFASSSGATYSQEAFEESCRERAECLEEKLHHFGVKGNVTAVRPGPVITLFEYAPEIDTKISKIMALEDDLALALRAMSIRILAPIPGRNVVGFEISNESRQSVMLSTILHDALFAQTTDSLPLILGVDIVGDAVIEDLLGMPHLLVAGSTGSGKSVGLNGMLFSLLCKKLPEEMRLILIDPKRLEFAPYNDIPHLLFPIVTNPRKAAPVLKWLVREMEDRYEKMAKLGVRSLQDYQRQYQAYAQSGDARIDGLESLPYIVLVIDELADLMMVAGKEIELYIARLAQMARAAGIHMILATQRPSVDVITGLIKVNLPSRIAYRVSSKIDSKTILDGSGAEKLLGRGDMLFMNARIADLRRVHGSYVSDEEIAQLTDYLRAQAAPDYLDLQEELACLESKEVAEQDKDNLFDEVYDFVQTQEEISISQLQRKYRIGYNRSARLIEQLELEGLLAPAQGSKPRKVLTKR